MGLRLRLTLGTVGVVGAAIALFSIAASLAFSRGLITEFDARLAADARELAGMVEEHAQAPWEFEAGGLDEFEPGPAPAYFQLRLDDGFLLARSASLGEGNLSGSAEGVTRLRLPDGRWGRVRVMALQPRHPEDAPVPATGRLVQVSVARSTDEIDATLLLLDEVLLGAGLFAMLLAAVAATWIVRSGLQPLGLLARQLDHIDAQRLSERVDRSAHPPELRAAVDKVNELLARLEAAFARARQFNADVSHELRTPLSGLKLILEVALSRERDVESYRVALTRSLKVVGQLSGLVESLLLLARLGAGQVPLRPARLELRELVDECFAPFAEVARARGLRFENAVKGEDVVEADETALRMIVGNLVSNAVAYTASGGSVVVEGPSAEAVLRVRDSGPTLVPEDLERIFGAFIRLDGSRTDTEAHCGIGLTLTRALAGAMGLQVTAQNLDGWLHLGVAAVPQSRQGMVNAPTSQHEDLLENDGAA